MNYFMYISLTLAFISIVFVASAIYVSGSSAKDCNKLMKISDTFLYISTGIGIVIMLIKTII